MVFRKVQKALKPNGESFLSFCALHLHSTSGVRNHLMKRAFDKTLRQLPPKRPSAFCGLGLRARTMAMTITVFIAVCPCPRLEGPAMCGTASASNWTFGHAAWATGAPCTSGLRRGPRRAALACLGPGDVTGRLELQGQHLRSINWFAKDP